jgi:hypothetical protein
MDPDSTEMNRAGSLARQLKEIVLKAREQAFRQSNSILLHMYWQVGRLIVEDEQKGKAKAVYGKSVLKNLSQQLTLEFGKGFDETNLRNMRQFYNAFPIRDAVRHELSWTHYRILSRIEEESVRWQYVTYSADNGHFAGSG